MENEEKIFGYKNEHPYAKYQNKYLDILTKQGTAYSGKVSHIDKKENEIILNPAVKLTSSIITGETVGLIKSEEGQIINIADISARTLTSRRTIERSCDLGNARRLTKEVKETLENLEKGVFNILRKN